jgi:hypothetical protein
MSDSFLFGALPRAPRFNALVSGRQKKGSDLFWYTAFRKSDTALLSLLSVALSSVSVKRIHYTTNFFK